MIVTETKELVLKWYYRAQLDYFDTYINLYIAYNAWFKKVTEESKDRAGIEKLKLRSDIWNEYLAGTTMSDLAPYLDEMVAITNAEPLGNLTGDNKHWDGIVKDTTDWKSLIEYWYRIRCNLFHGTKSPEDIREAQLVELAYKSLNVFMSEIVNRIENNFSKNDVYRLYEISKLKDSTEQSLKANTYADARSKEVDTTYLIELDQEYEYLMKRLEAAKDLWAVDLKGA